MMDKSEKKSLFRLGRDRYGVFGREAYTMKYPHHDCENRRIAALAAQAYLAGVKCNERGLSPDRELREILSGAA